MKVKLKSKETIDSLYSEDDLKELSIMESIYSIRILKALTDSLENGYIDVIDKGGKVFSEKHQIFLYHYYIID